MCFAFAQFAAEFLLEHRGPFFAEGEFLFRRRGEGGGGGEVRRGGREDELAFLKPGKTDGVDVLASDVRIAGAAVGPAFKLPVQAGLKDLAVGFDVAIDRFMILPKTDDMDAVEEDASVLAGFLAEVFQVSEQRRQSGRRGWVVNFGHG